jgi:hypothetical protein
MYGSSLRNRLSKINGLFCANYFTVMHCHPLSVSIAVVWQKPHSQLDPWRKVFISSLLHLLGKMHNYCLLLLIWSPFMVPGPSLIPWPVYLQNLVRSGIYWTLLYHTNFSCQGEISETCTHNKTPILLVVQGMNHSKKVGDKPLSAQSWQRAPYKMLRESQAEIQNSQAV